MSLDNSFISWTWLSVDLEGLGRLTISYAWLGFISIILFFTLSGDIRERCPGLPTNA